MKSPESLSSEFPTNGLRYSGSTFINAGHPSVSWQPCIRGRDIGLLFLLKAGNYAQMMWNIRRYQLSPMKKCYVLL